MIQTPFTFTERMVAAWRHCAYGTPLPAPQRPVAARVGLLNTGELVVIPGDERPIVVFSADTTDLVRDALASHDGSVHGVHALPGAVGSAP